MTTTAGDTRGAAASPVRSVLLHGAGLLLVLALLPVSILLGVPLAAWAIAAGLVVANRIVQGAVAWGVRDASLTVQLGSHGFSMLFRAMVTALTLFLVGASVGAAGDARIGMDRPDLAKPALLLFILCFTLDAGIEAIRRAGQREAELSADLAAATPRETTA
jgi:hypothetical protein